MRKLIFMALMIALAAPVAAMADGSAPTAPATANQTCKQALKSLGATTYAQSYATLSDDQAMALALDQRREGERLRQVRQLDLEGCARRGRQRSDDVQEGAGRPELRGRPWREDLQPVLRRQLVAG